MKARDRAGRERGLRSYADAGGSTSRCLGAASITRLQYATGASHTQNAWTEVEPMKSLRPRSGFAASSAWLTRAFINAIDLRGYSGRGSGGSSDPPGENVEGQVCKHDPPSSATR